VTIPGKRKNVFTAAARITSDEVVAYHGPDDAPIIGSRIKSYHIGMRASGPLKAFLEPAAHQIMRRSASDDFTTSFKKAVDDPGLALKLQNAVAVEGLIESLPMVGDYGELMKFVADAFAHTTLPIPPPGSGAEKISDSKIYHRLKDWLDNLANDEHFLNPEGSRMFQRCIRQACLSYRGEQERKGSLFARTPDECVQEVMQKKRWLPSSNGPHSSYYQRIRLTDFASVQQQGDDHFVVVDEEKLEAAKPALRAAAETSILNAVNKLKAVRTAARIDKEEFAEPAFTNKEARERLRDAFDSINLKTIGGKMVLKALSNSNLSVVMVNRNRVTDYSHGFNDDYLNESRKKKPGGAGGFSEMMPYVYIGCRSRSYTPDVVVEELVHHAFGLLYENDQDTYALHKHYGYRHPDKLARDRAMHAQKEGFEEALTKDLERIAQRDDNPGSAEMKMARAEKQLRKDIRMTENLYQREDFDAEIATKIIKMETIGTWDVRLDRRWSNLSAFVHDKIGKDVDNWVGQDAGITGRKSDHADKLRAPLKPEGRT